MMLAAPPAYSWHPVHDPSRHWPQSNCSLDLWIEFLHHRGLAPEAAMAALVRIDDEGDQFTFCKFDNTDIAAFYGLDVLELGMFGNVEQRIALQTSRDHLVMVEVDSFYLPDTSGTSYRLTHTKTTIGIDQIDPAARQLSYFHNAGRYSLGPEDYAGLFRSGSEYLVPYTEFVKSARPALLATPLHAASAASFRSHLAKAPTSNPFISYRSRFAADLAMLAEQPPEYFHSYAFHHFRQFGAVFELLGWFSGWLAHPQGDILQQHCLQIAAAAKLLQFRAARANARRIIDPCTAIFVDLAFHWDAAFDWMRRHYGENSSQIPA